MYVGVCRCILGVYGCGIGDNGLVPRWLRVTVCVGVCGCIRECGSGCNIVYIMYCLRHKRNILEVVGTAVIIHVYRAMV